MAVVQLVQQWLPVDGWSKNPIAVHPAGLQYTSES